MGNFTPPSRYEALTGPANMSKQVIGDNQPWLINPIPITFVHSVQH